MQANRFSPAVCLMALLVTAAPALSDDDPIVSSRLAAINDRLTELGMNVRVVKAEFLTASNSNQSGNTLIADDRNKQLDFQWVPNDQRRNADGNKISYLVDQSDATPNGGVSSANVEAAIDRAMNTWNSVTCATIPIVKHADNGDDPDVIDGLLGFGDVGTPFLADIVEAGWMPPAFFEFIFPGGGSSFLAITFTMVLHDPASGDDINNDKKLDVAFRETYYNNYFQWGINADPPVADIESVALHEAGHGLSQGHFGKIFLNQDNKLKFAPFAVMNAVMFGQNHELQGTDIGGHCSIWGSWPNQ